MGVRQIFIDEQIAHQAEEIAAKLGYPGAKDEDGRGVTPLENYIMDLIEQDIAEKQEQAAIFRSIIQEELELDERSS